MKKEGKTMRNSENAEEEQYKRYKQELTRKTSTKHKDNLDIRKEWQKPKWEYYLTT